jgi:hypothetical protein
MYRIESLRMFLEEKLGMDTFIKLYHLLNDDNDNNPAAAGSSGGRESEENNNSEVDEEIARLLTKDQMPLLSLVHQLIFCEDRLYDSP